MLIIGSFSYKMVRFERKHLLLLLNECPRNSIQVKFEIGISLEFRNSHRHIYPQDLFSPIAACIGSYITLILSSKTFVLRSSLILSRVLALCL